MKNENLFAVEEYIKEPKVAIMKAEGNLIKIQFLFKDEELNIIRKGIKLMGCSIKSNCKSVFVAYIRRFRKPNEEGLKELCYRKYLEEHPGDYEGANNFWWESDEVISKPSLYPDFEKDYEWKIVEGIVSIQKREK